ncbi:hypothetical protein JCM11641_000440 [Rhodosporidiobolus odoratus]
MAPSIVVHWLEDSRAQRIVWMLEELGLEYEVKRYMRDPKTHQAPKELCDIHPLGRSPVVVVTEGAHSVTLAESGAITEFFIERYGNGQFSIPPDVEDFTQRSDYLYWLHYAEGSAMTGLMFAMVFGGLPKRAPFFVRPIVNGISAGAMSGFVIPVLKNNYSYFERALEGKDFLIGGKLTGADFLMSFIAEALITAPLNVDDYPNIKRWHESLQQRPAYIRALDKGGKNDLTRFAK